MIRALRLTDTVSRLLNDRGCPENWPPYCQSLKLELAQWVIALDRLDSSSKSQGQACTRALSAQFQPHRRHTSCRATRKVSEGVVIGPSVPSHSRRILRGVEALREAINYKSWDLR
jgi:hypothetical protein